MESLIFRVFSDVILVKYKEEKEEDLFENLRKYWQEISSGKSMREK